MKLEYHADFNLKDCIAAMGLEERGRVQQHVAEKVQILSNEYIPLNVGALRDSGYIENGTDVVWNTPYARYQWNGLIYEDPQLHCAGFKTDAGWRSRKDVQKVPTNRKMTYQGGTLRGPKWVDRMLNNGGREAIEQSAREMAKK